MKDPVLIKSNKYGITVFFQQELPFEQLMEETLEKFRSAKHFFNHAEMVVEFEGRAFTEEEILRMADAIQTAADIQILCLLERDTRTEEIHKQAYHESLQVIHERDGLFYKGTLRKKHRDHRGRRRRRYRNVQRKCYGAWNDPRYRDRRRRRQARRMDRRSPYGAKETKDRRD